MNNWYKVKISYKKPTNEEGVMKNVSETHLLEAVSFTDAETRIMQILDGGKSFVIGDITKVRFAEVFLNSKERFYTAKVGFNLLDEKADTEKIRYVQMLVQADDIQDALNSLDKAMIGTLSDYEISSIKETDIVDVFQA